MKKIFVISVQWFILANSVFAQKNAFVLKHVGASNSIVRPLVFSTSDVQDSFANKWLKLTKHYYFKPKNIYNVVVDSTDLFKLDSLFFSIIVKKTDTTASNYAFGSFEFISIKQEKQAMLAKMNNYNISMEILKEFADNIYALRPKNFQEIIVAVGNFRERFEPNPTKQVTNEVPPD